MLKMAKTDKVVKAKTAKLSAKPGLKQKPFKNGTAKVLNKGNKSKITQKKEKSSKTLKDDELKMDVSGNEPMEVDFISDKTSQKKEKNKKKKVTESQKHEKKLGKVNKVKKEKSADKSDVDPDKKKGFKRKRMDSDEASKPKKAKVVKDKEGKSKKAQLEAAPFKERRKARKMQNKNYELGSKAKYLWEQLRRFDLTAEKRQEICQELYELVKGQMNVLIYSHDTSRVIQSLVKYGSKEHRDAIFDELKGHLLQIIMCKYAKFYIRKLLKYGKKEQRDYVFQQLSGHYKKLLKHKEASLIIEIIYNNYANVTQRRAIAEEFCGKSIKLLKTEELKTVEDIIKADPSKRELLMGSLRKTLSTLMTKSILEYSLIHHLFLEYFTNADDAMRSDMIETAREGLIHMLHTRDGSRVAMIGLWHGTAKDRKVIVKTFKTFVAKICKEEHGHLVMLALFDVVDDTKLVQKAILDELLRSVDELAADNFGRKVLLYLLSPRNPHYFHPDIISVLQKGDGNTHSKKEPEIRRQELLQYVSQPLLQWIVDNCETIASNNSLLTLAHAILKQATGNLIAAMQALAKIAAKPFTASDDNHLVSNAAGHMTLKHLTADDAQRSASSQNVLFSNILLDTVPKPQLLSWLTSNRGCFVLVSMFETGIPEVVARLKDLLTGAEKTLIKQKFAGAQVLLKKMSQ